MGVQNVLVILSLGTFSHYFQLFLSFIHGFLPAHGRKTDYIINMAQVNDYFVDQKPVD